MSVPSSIDDLLKTIGRSTHEVCETFFGAGIRSVSRIDASEAEPSDGAVIDIDGERTVRVSVHPCRQFVSHAAQVVMGEAPSADDPLWDDVVREMANMIAGLAKRDCDDGQMKLGLPQSLRSDSGADVFAHFAEVQGLQCTTSHGDVYVRFARSAGT